MGAADTHDFNRSGVLQEFGVMIGRLTRVVDGAVLVCGYWLVYDSHWWLDGHQRIAECMISLLVSLFAGSIFGLSRSWRIIRIRHEVAEIVPFCTLLFLCIAAIFVMAGFVPVDGAAYWIPALFRWYSFTLLASIVLRVLLRLSLRYFRAYGFDQRTAAFVGATDTAVRLAATFRHHSWMGMRVTGFFDDRIAAGRTPPPGVPAVTGGVDALVALAREGLVSHIYITLPMEAEHRVRTIIDRFSDTTASIYFCPSMLGFDLIGARWDEVYGQPVISVVESPFYGYSRLLKRLEDGVLVALLLPLLLPVMLVIGVAVRMGSPGPALYRQQRFGLDGKPITVFKFRTMYVAEGDAAFVQARRGDARITRLGGFLRRTSLDELPQFLNVLNGTMSVVGPRPHPVKLNEDYRPVVRRYMMRHKVKPGITGLAQISGARGETDSVDKMERRVGYDLAYMRNWSLWLDLRILARTLFVPLFDRSAF